ncbi:flagellar basal body P-ring formation chaperone FlgA [Bacteriovorax sp. Seq25_V]|uniref:flagellar basal body P-ring formation chaperone FlgA n=1 Tax=Bacteriovorax sp. Seq25_V TaxID=1201288 RepID=UPI00038A4EDC|nr:flagellar basal body P-ring formation chaperone FlgA [Bacteriovorax sp. Seq25_V]EQC43398.1 flagella basal body P-ring formation protein FlgA [Bacteriovorax sp. Seq25_V]
MRKLFATFAILLSTTSIACTINGADTIFTYGETKNATITTTGCDQSQVEAINELIKESSGTLEAGFITRYPDLKNVKLSPSSIRVRNLEELVTSRLNIESNKKIEIIDQSIQSDFLNLTGEQYLQVYCDECTTNGLKTLRLVKTNGTNHETHWVKARLLSAVKTVVAAQDLHLQFTATPLDQFSYEVHYVLKPEEYITDKRDLTFYRLNKSVSRGALIKRSDLTPVQIVKYGTPVKVMLNQSNIKLTSTATPIGSGHFGDTIKLRNLKTNKIFTATVSGINEVRIDL